MTRTNTAHCALYTCTRYPGLTARMLVGSGRAINALPHSDLAAYTRTRCHVQTARPQATSHAHRARCSMTRTNTARDALYTCTRYPGLTARMVVGSGRAMDALPHSDLAATIPIG